MNGCQKITKVTNKSSNQELISITINRGWIHGEIGEFLGVLQIQSSLMTNWVEKLEILYIWKEYSMANT